MTLPPLIVFTDLDGTLLDHETYSHSAALPALERLKSLRIPVVLASSKTAAEIAPIRQQMGFADAPAIVENGAGLLNPGQNSLGDSTDYAQIRAALDSLPENLRAPFRGFGDLGIGGVAQATGLSPENASLACLRQFSEPGLWSGRPKDRTAFINALAKQGISAREGGRFLTFSLGSTKADRMAEIADSFGAPPSVALGDAPNDVEMLQAATYGVIIANPHRQPLPNLRGEETGQIRRTNLPGPEGWNAAINEILNELGL
ncbi:HAD-IIB family hydrolase [Actibacterium pelagium]|uniref:Mannosyl-3-phosphoglycerate phosphatase n=1 Tax=Actibacterium pelagium TaxID=2029103 RepID=A0A917EMS7_9RHOB|nr:HAD-IIB family hydrolase [Actibacterium pelagium]GGE61021.1 mannosyl-3-phosphoglycerate phosphatase [Actibacterium pelagium]